MKKKCRFYGGIKDGKLHLDRKDLFDVFLPSMEGKRVEVTIEKESEDPTQKMWGYLYSIVYPAIALETGYTIAEVDGMLKKRHLTKNQGLKTEYVVDKSDLDREQLINYIDLCLLDAGNLGIIVPPPNKDWKLKNK